MITKCKKYSKSLCEDKDVKLYKSEL
ncbi:unnamed protein product, partial [Rotaria sp. Silwood1]